MFKVNKKKLKKILVTYLGYDDEEAERYIEYFPDKLDERLKKLYKNWIRKRTVLDLEIDGVKVKEYMENRNCGFLPMILDINKFLQLDKESKQKLRESYKIPSEIW